MVRLVVAIAGGFALAGCSLEATPWTMNTREMVLPYLSDGCLMSSPKSERVKVISRGSEPHRPLRFVQRAQPVELRVASAAPFTANDYTLRLAWIDAGNQHQGCYQFQVGGPRTAHIEDPVVGVAKVSERGTISFATDALDGKSYELERDLAWALDRADPVLPKGPVGVGAEWRVRAGGLRSGERIELEVVYRLTSLEGSRVVLDVMRSVHRPAQRVQGPRGYSKQVEDVMTKERGVLEFDLQRRPFPSGRFWNEKGEEFVRISAAYPVD
jgi:hypothetical protein